MKTSLAVALHEIGQAVARVERGHRVDVNDLVDAAGVILPRLHVGVADHAHPFEVDAFDQVGRLDVEAGDETDFMFAAGSS